MTRQPLNRPTSDSGARQDFDSGMSREPEGTRPRFDLLVPLTVPYEEQLLTRCAALMARGARKYSARNWELADSPEEVERMRSSAFRHFMQWLCGETDEDHAAAIVFNVLAAETTQYRVDHKEAQSPVNDAIDPADPEHDVVTLDEAYEAVKRVRKELARQ